MKAEHVIVGDVRAKGCLMGIELVKDRKSREPDPDSTASVFEHARDHGLILSKSGPHRSILRFVPPLCLSMDDVDTIAEGLEASFNAV